MAERVLFEQGSTILDANGYGTVTLRASGERWIIGYTSVSARIDGALPVLESSCFVYRNYIGDAYLVDNTISGSSGDTSDTLHEVLDGEALVFVWIGGDAGAAANVQIRGKGYSTTEGGFRAL